MPFGVNSIRSQVLYWAAQESAREQLLLETAMSQYHTMLSSSAFGQMYITCLLLAKVAGYQGHRALGVGPGEASWKWPIMSCHPCAPPRQRDAWKAWVAGRLYGEEGGGGGGGVGESAEFVPCKQSKIQASAGLAPHGRQPSALH